MLYFEELSVSNDKMSRLIENKNDKLYVSIVDSIMRFVDKYYF